MNSRCGPSFFLSGLCVSLIWHAWWFFIFAPRAAVPERKALSSEAVFLGAFLERRDFGFSAGGGFDGGVAHVESTDFSKNSYFTMRPAAVKKPLASATGRDFSAGVHDFGTTPRRSAPVSFRRHIVMDARKENPALSDITFKDIRGILEREDLGAFIDVKAVAVPDGRLLSLEKAVGSGDPVVDFYILRKLKGALLRHPPDRETSVTLRVWIKGQDVPN